MWMWLNVDVAQCGGGSMWRWLNAVIQVSPVLAYNTLLYYCYKYSLPCGCAHFLIKTNCFDYIPWTSPRFCTDSRLRDRRRCHVASLTLRGWGLVGLKPHRYSKGE